MDSIIQLETTCPSITRFQVVVGTMAPLLVKTLDKKYLWQKLEFTQIIDRELKKYIMIDYPRIVISDTHFLTNLEPTFDGVHLLIKTNLELTNYVLQTMELI